MTTHPLASADPPIVVGCVLGGFRHEQHCRAPAAAEAVAVMLREVFGARRVHWALRDDTPTAPTLVFTHRPRGLVHAVRLVPGIPAQLHQRALCGRLVRWTPPTRVCTTDAGDACPHCVRATRRIPGWTITTSRPRPPLPAREPMSTGLSA